MAVKIIKAGPDKKVTKRAICKGCGATLEYVPNDVREYNGTDMGGGPDGHQWIDCPQCQKKVILKSW